MACGLSGCACAQSFEPAVQRAVGRLRDLAISHARSLPAKELRKALRALYLPALAAKAEQLSGKAAEGEGKEADAEAAAAAAAERASTEWPVFVSRDDMATLFAAFPLRLLAGSLPDKSDLAPRLQSYAATVTQHLSPASLLVVAQRLYTVS